MRRQFYRFLVAAFIFMATGAAAWAAGDSVEAEVYFQNGVKYMKRGLYDKSIQEFEKTLAIDATNEEAAAYLEQVKELYRQDSPVQAKASEDTAMRALYRDGRNLYQQGEYEKAIEVFTAILAKKPIDDYASYYRERSEIMISRRQAKERKAADKQRQIEEKARKKEMAEQAKAQKKAVRQETLQKRALIQEEQRQAREARGEKPVVKKAAEAVPPAAVVDEQKPLTPREEKIRAKKERQEEAERRAQERRQEELRAKEEKIQARDEARAQSEQKVEARKESKKTKQDKAREKKAAVRMEKELSAEEQRQNKDLFIAGLEAYSQKDYEKALASFSELIEAEKKSGLVYTSTAKRMIEKAQKRMAGVGRDVAV
jgi:tetratricopeptide (TPR) repeat protein